MIDPQTCSLNVLLFEIHRLAAWHVETDERGEELERLFDAFRTRFPDYKSEDGDPMQWLNAEIKWG